MIRKALILLLLVLSACTDAVIPYSSPQIVVEGWIEDGGAPVVIVTTSVPVSSEKQELSSLEDNVVRWATVSVSDGEKEVFLTGKKNDDYFPPYIYTTAMLTGEVGKTYKLKVKYSGLTVESETVIPPTRELEYLRVEESDGKYVLMAGLEDNRQTKDYYKFFIRVYGRDSVFASSFPGLIDDEILSDGLNEISIRNTYAVSTVQKDSAVFFNRGDRVGVKFSAMNKEGYEYWEDFDDVASLSVNPLFPVTKKIRSNIKGGLGYWIGYGSSYYYIECK